MGLSDFFIDVALLPSDGYGFFQLISLGCIYAYILFYASNMISDGSELLLLVPSMAGLVGEIPNKNKKIPYKNNKIPYKKKKIPYKYKRVMI